MKNIFTEHPQQVGEVYLQHFKFAFLFGFDLMIGGLACIIHAIFPFMFEKTGSNFLFKCMQKFIERTKTVDDRAIKLMHLIEDKIKRDHSS